MGCNQSKIENEEAVSRCKLRKHIMKDAVSYRNAFAAAHSSYATCLKNAGAALSDYAHGEVHNPQFPSAAPLPGVTATITPQQFEIPPPPPPLPNFSPSPLQRAASMPEMKMTKPEVKPVGTIIEEEEEENELENEGLLRRRRSNKSGSGGGGSVGKRVEEEEPLPPPMPTPPTKQAQQQQQQQVQESDHGHVSHHHAMQQPQQSSAWEYFFPSMENIAGTSLNAAEEEHHDHDHHLDHDHDDDDDHDLDLDHDDDQDHHLDKEEEIERKVFQEKANRVDGVDNVVRSERVHEVPVPQPVPLPEEVVETPVQKGKVKQVQGSMEGKRIENYDVNLMKVFADLDDHFLKASESALEVTKMLEATRLHYHSNFADNRGHIDHSARVMRVITWNRSFKGIPNLDDGKDDFDLDEQETHATVLDKLLAWEKKLYDEVKAGELMKYEYQRKVAILNRLKKRGNNSEALEKAKASVSHLHTRYIVDMQSLDSTVSEIDRLRDEQLYPRLVQLVDGMATMWKIMLAHHEEQSKRVTLLGSMDISQSPTETSEHHHERTYQLFLVAQQWHSQFEMLVDNQKKYIKSLYEWLKLNLIPIESSLKEKVSSPPRVKSPPIQGLLLSWNDRLEKLPDELARTAIRNFAAVIDTIFRQQEDEMVLKKKCEDTRKELARKTRQFEDWYNKYMQRKIPDELDPERADGPDEVVTEKQFLVDQIKRRLEQEEEDYAKQCLQVRQKSLGSLKNRMPELFRAMVEISLECSKMYSELKSISQNLGQSSS